MTYKKEIDGLRAIAVSSIILFHAGIKSFSGGFVGVDVFFVISGYLISQSIIKDMQSDKFSLLKFYVRRARRILPALFLVLLFCLPAAWFLLLPPDMTTFSETLIAVSTYLSNVYFWRTSSYFHPTTELNPLIHTWSLSVEEQFYLLFPILFILVSKFHYRWRVLLCVFIFSTSIILSEYYVSRSPSANFFLLPTRVWEFILGAITAKLTSSYKPTHFGIQVLSCSGLALIVLAVLFYDNNIPYPGFYALLPTVGTALILYCSSSHTIVGIFLSNRLFSLIGLSSYSLYLWHQPIFAFSKHLDFDVRSTNITFLLLALTFFAGYISWKFVEQPFRCSSKISTKWFLSSTIIFTLLFLLLGWIGVATNGLTIRYSADQMRFIQYFDNSPPEWKFFSRTGVLNEYRNQCNFYNVSMDRQGSPTSVPISSYPEECWVRNHLIPNSVFLWGDSHAQQLYPGLSRTIPKSWQVLQVTSSGCQAKIIKSQSKINYCDQSNWFAIQAIKETKPDVVVVASSATLKITEMIEIRDYLITMGVTKVIFTGPSPRWRIDLPKIVAFRLWPTVSNRTFYGLDEFVLNQDKSLSEIFPVDSKSIYLSIISTLCTIEGCLVYVGNDVKTGITTWDYGHLMPAASEKFAREALVPAIIGDEGQGLQSNARLY